MEQLTEIEKEMIAGLGNYPAFLLLLRLLETGVSVMEEEMIKIPNEKDAMWAFQYWKAVKRIYKFLATQPEQFGNELAVMLEERRQAMGGAEFDSVELTMRQTYPFQGPAEDQI